MARLTTKQLLDGLEAQIRAAEENLERLKTARAALTGGAFMPARRGISPTGIAVVSANNTLRRLKRERADKTEIATVKKELNELRAKLAREKSERVTARRKALGGQ